MLEVRGRMSLARSADEWVRAALRAPGTSLLPLAPEISVESTRLPDDPPGDPADRMLIASARIAGARLVTCDVAIVRYAGQGHAEVLDARP
jgi:PIN domain nuclease of toxin-antitoxin system